MYVVPVLHRYCIELYYVHGRDSNKEKLQLTLCADSRSAASTCDVITSVVIFNILS